MIPAIIGGALGLGSMLYGGIKSAKAAREQNKMIDKQAADNQNWYNKNYYQDYMDRSDARAAMRRVTDFMKRRDQNIAKTAAVTGGTTESVVAQQENAQKAIADTVGNIAANADNRKDQIDAINQQNQNNITNARMQQAQLSESGGAQLANAGMAGIANAIGSYASSLGSSKITPGMIRQYGQMTAADSLNKLKSLTSNWGV